MWPLSREECHVSIDIEANGAARIIGYAKWLIDRNGAVGAGFVIR